MKTLYHHGIKIKYTMASRDAGLCVLCYEDIRFKSLIVRDRGLVAHLRCAHPEAYAARRAWVQANAPGRTSPVEVRHKPSLKRVTVI